MADLKQRANDAKTWALEQWARFRAESAYFQARAGLVAAYVVVVLLTILIAPPKTEPWVIREERISFGLSFKTAIEVTNVTNGDLEDAVIEVRGQGVEYDGRKVPGTWRTKPMTLVEGLNTKVLSEQLFDAREMSPPFSLEVDVVTVYDDDKEALVSRAPLKGPAK